MGTRFIRLVGEVLKSTHDLCFGTEIQVYPCIPQFYNMKVGFKGVFIAGTSFPDAIAQAPGYCLRFYLYLN